MQDLLEFFSNQGILIQPEALAWAAAKKQPLEYVKALFQKTKELPLFITVEDLQRLECEGGQQERPSAAMEYGARLPEMVGAHAEGACGTIKAVLNYAADAAVESNETMTAQSLARVEQAVPAHIDSYPKDIQIMDAVTNQSCSEGELKDFVKCFRDRFDSLKKILRMRNELSGTVQLDHVRERGGDVRTIGIVYDVRTTVKGHVLIELEDETDRMPVLIPQSNRQLIDFASKLVRDEVIGIVGRMSKDLLIADNVLQPEVPCADAGSANGATYVREPICATFISDIHIGSDTFLTGAWNRFIGWLNGEVGTEEQRALARRTRYLVVAGDDVDGVGIYPGQEEELAIPDVYAQYEALASEIAKIPKHITVIMTPGNHDAIRLAEPQPAFPESITKLFSPNVIFVSNPCYFVLHGVKILAYHGRSIDDLIAAIPGLSHNEPIAVMIEMLKRRHLAPIYGLRTALAPEERDHLVIREVPDIFVTGHVHACGVQKYKGILLINASTWQSQTSYQKMLGFEPEPAKAIVVDLRTRQTAILSFEDDEA